jgi:hypothetical protein
MGGLFAFGRRKDLEDHAPWNVRRARITIRFQATALPSVKAPDYFAQVISRNSWACVMCGCVGITRTLMP